MLHGFSEISLTFLLSIFLPLKISFIEANSTDLDEMPHYAAFHQGLQRLPKDFVYG